MAGGVPEIAVQIVEKDTQVQLLRKIEASE